MESYLVTGGAGFIGANFVKYILGKHSNNIRLLVLDKLTYAGNLKTLEGELDRIEFVRGDICDTDLVGRLFTTYDIRYVVNFAAESHVDRSIESPQVFLETNILGTQNLLEASRRFWQVDDDEYRPGCKFLQVSTDEVYGSLGETGFFTEDTPLAPRSPYSASKAGADLIVQAYVETYKFPANITRCSNNYGPYQFPEKLIPLMIKNTLEGIPLPVYGDGGNVRDWIYVEDHCRALDAVLHKGRLGEVYNIGGQCEWQNIDTVTLIIDTARNLLSQVYNGSQALKTEVSNINDDLIKFVKDRKGHDRRYAIDPSKIKSELGWYPRMKFEEGIVETISWYIENQDWVNEIISGDYRDYYDRMYKNR